jgi:hypothetical protein
MSRHNWQRISNLETGDAYDQCHFCGRIRHVDVIGKTTDPTRGVAGVTTFGQGGTGGFGV